MAIQLIQPSITQQISSIVNGFNKPTKQTFSHKGIPLILQRVVALIGLVMITPLLLIVILLIKIGSQGGAIFSQTRVGENGRHFQMYKFRSMYLKTDKNYQQPNPAESSREGVCKKYINDPRITSIGRFIRKYSIDELPQLFNVVNGDMCLIGPRPALNIETYEYDNHAQSRLYVKPGLTGLWQVSGRADTSFEEQVELDRTYIKQQSIMLDLKVLFMTVPAVLLSKGAY